VASDSPPSARARARTYWVRKTLTPPPATETSAPAPGRKNPASPPGKRFVEPYRLSDGQREAILATLEEHALGDRDSRMLFTAALEYDLAGCPGLGESAPAPAKPKRPRPSAAERATAEIAAAARALADQLGQLEPAAAGQLQAALKDADRFKRSYGDDYLRALRVELDRVASAVIPRPPAEVPQPQVPEAANRFIRRAADAFGDCFETPANAQRGSGFLAALKAIAEATGVRIPVDQRTVAEILARP
jgi:hypothetical protein